MQPTLLERLTAWLDERVYETGVLLYQQIHGAGFMLTMLKSGPDDYNRQKLDEALEAHHQQLLDEQKTLVESYPESLTSDLDRAKSLMDLRTVTKERMRILYDQGISKGDQLKGYAFDILKLGDELSGIYGRKEFFEENGYMPDEPEEDLLLTEAALVKRMLSVRTYVTKYTKRVSQADTTSPDYQKLVDKLTEYTSEVHHLQRQIDALNQAQYDQTVFD